MDTANFFLPGGHEINPNYRGFSSGTGPSIKEAKASLDTNRNSAASGIPVVFSPGKAQVDFYRKSSGEMFDQGTADYLAKTGGATSWDDLFKSYLQTNPGAYSQDQIMAAYDQVMGKHPLGETVVGGQRVPGSGNGSFLPAKSFADPWAGFYNPGLARTAQAGNTMIPSISNKDKGLSFVNWDLNNPEQLNLARAMYVPEVIKASGGLGYSGDHSDFFADKIFTPLVMGSLAAAGGVAGGAFLGPSIGAAAGAGAGAGMTSGFIGGTQSGDPWGGMLKGGVAGGLIGAAAGGVSDLVGYNPSITDMGEGASAGTGGLGTAGHAVGDAAWAPGVSGTQAGIIQGIDSALSTNNLLTQLGKELVTSTITGKDFSLGNVGTNLVTSGVSNVAGNVMPSVDGSAGTELARAGVSGTAGGLISAARGGDFGTGFTSGAVSRGAGDALRYANNNLTNTGPILTGDTAKSVIENTAGAVGQIAIGTDTDKALTGAGAGILGDLAGSYVKDLNLTGNTLINDALGTGTKQAVGGLINSTYSNDTVPLVPDEPIAQVSPPSSTGGVGGFGRMTKDFTGGGLNNFESTAVKKTRGTI